MRMRGLFAVVRCPSVRLSDAFVYCIQKAEFIVKLLSLPRSPIILVFFDPERQYQIPSGTPSSGALNTWRVGTICNFRLKSSFISETVQDRPIVAMTL